MKNRFVLPFVLVFLFAVTHSATAQSKKKMKALFEGVELYVGIKKYDNYGREKRQDTIFIHPEKGSYADLVITRNLFSLPEGEYRFKTYIKQGNKYVEHKYHQTNFKRATELRAQMGFNRTGSYLIEVYKGKDYLIGDINLEVRAQKLRS